MPLRLLLFLALTLSGLGCRSSVPVSAEASATTPARWPEGVAYEVFVQSFADSDGDSVGDLRGLTQRLDYIRDLGARAIWLMPISPSPSYHKYDVTDYRGIHPAYGTLDDARTLVREAHARGIAVIIDLVINHSARAHPWFQAAVADPQSPYRDYYVWATPEQVAQWGAGREAAPDSDNRVAWHRVPGQDAFYYGYFGRHMPDLNFDSPALRREILDIGRFWLREVGVDGFRLDAAKHIYPTDRAADNHAWWQLFRAEMQAVNPNVYLVGEVWDGPAVVAPYLKGLTALFNFDLAGAMLRAVREERADSLVPRLARIRGFYRSVEPGFTDATFLANHDQNRVMTVLGDDERKARVAAALLLTLPGSPFLYYGEEIGMKGRKPDPNIREPMLWGDAHSARTPRWITPTYSTPQNVRPVAAQQDDPGSLLRFYRDLIALRNGSPTLTRGEVATTDVGSNAVVSFLRMHAGDTLWVAHNVTGTDQTIHLPTRLHPFTRLRYRSAQPLMRTNETLVLPAYSSAVFARR
ncbi:MAG TPA: alpha-amylase family glycosyl hydrolase [Rhodothermales bacterium]|nr:alpha-amylase family glycosyl hydrolase [Rhodothermales bacterium]